MENKTDSLNQHFEKYKDFSVDLALAIQKLEFFTEHQTSSNLHVHHLNDQNTKTNSTLQETIERVRFSLSLAFSEKARERARKKQHFIQMEVFKAIQTIQKNYFLIQKLKKGNKVEQALADSTLKVIQRYNQTIDTISKKTVSLKERISNFIYKRFGLSNDQELKKTIHLPLELSSDYLANPKSYQKINQTAVSFIHTEMQNQQIITGHEADAFRVKAISLLQNSGMRLTSVSEEFHTIRSTPIQATIHRDDLKRIMLTQILKPFPGETIAFKGEFQRNLEALDKSVPLRESFEIMTNFYQTGFPHPIQNTGWAFADCMIPLCPLRLDLLKDFSKIFKQKQIIASALLPKGYLNSKAKEILKMKKQVFEENRIYLLQQHLKLNKAILKAAPKEITKEKALAIIDSFFKNMQCISNPYDYYTETQETILQHFIIRPFEKLKEDFVDQKNIELYSKHFKNRYFAALEILNNETKTAILSFSITSDETKKSNTSTYDYICCMGQLIAEASHRIMLQHMSETIGFLPPKLDLYEMKIQMILYRQLISFQNELQIDKLNKEQCLENFHAEIEVDIANFKAGSVEELKGSTKEIIAELETYYHDQFYLNNVH